MLFKTILPLSALACLVAAVPLHQHELHHYPKREVVWTTKVVEEFVTAVVTTTIQMPAGQSPPPAGQPPAGTPANSPVNPPANTPANTPAATGHEEHHRPQITSHIHLTRTVTVHRAHPTEHHTPAASPTTAPAAPSPAQPTTEQSTNTAAPASPSSGGSSSGGSSGGSTSSGTKNTGDITYYTPGLGSCGVTNTASDMIVALAEDMMLPEDGANPNDNPLCGRSITISYAGKTAQATIEDTCPGCAGASLDLTPSLFEIFAPLATGRVSGVEWWFN